VNASDLAPPLIALGAVATIEGPGGRRDLALESFFTGPDVDPARENVLEPGEVLTGVTIPTAAAGWRGSYFKARERTAGDFPIVSLALGFELRDGRISGARVVLGGVAPTPRRAREAEAALEGNAPDETAAAAAAGAALANATPLDHNAYKLDLARALITRGVSRIAAG
jgi:xanthine dehydrogenase YagS FAD-binding subunit